MFTPKMLPYFSVVMPTFNRGHLIHFAIESVLQQTFEDFELIVSNGGSTDDTRAIVKKFDDPRIRYFEASQKISIGDNYQTGLNHSKGRYITFLSDDDAYVPMLFERLVPILERESAEIVGYPSAIYYHDGLIETTGPIENNTLALPKFDSGLTQFTAKESGSQILGLHGMNNVVRHNKFVCPYLANAVYHKDVFSRLSSVTPFLFHSVPADLYLAAAVFFVTEKYYCLDQPLHIWSNWKGNATASAGRTGNELRTHYETLLDGRTLENMPLKFALGPNCAANAIIQAKHDFGNRERETEVDWGAYYITMYEYLLALNDLGINVQRELREFYEQLEKELPEIRSVVRPKVRRFAYIAKSRLRKYVRLEKLARRVLGAESSGERILISGDDNDFHDVLKGSLYVASQMNNFDI
ncbi:MAG: glycosyltransferase family 2 protein [Pyrinomonadaceae bacterium]